MAQNKIAELREMLRKWGTYGPVTRAGKLPGPGAHGFRDGQGRFAPHDDDLVVGSAWTPIPVDELTDTQVIEVARAIAAQRKEQ